MSSRSVIRMFFTASVTVGALVIGPAPAGADEPPPDSHVLARGASVDTSAGKRDREGAALDAAERPSSCVEAAVEPRGIISQTVQVTNGCAATQRAKVVAAFAPDSECFVLPPDGQVRFAIDIGWLDSARFDGLEAC